MLDTLGNFLSENGNTMMYKEQFKQAENEWDLENLYADLVSVKGKNLTPMEKLHLRGLLCGCSPADIAEKLEKKVNGVEVDLSNTIYQYVKNLVNKSEEKLENWRNICCWLDDAGYKSQEIIQNQSNQSIPIDAHAHVSNVDVENQTIEIGVLIQLVLPLPTDSSKTDSN
jgi:hypothetical protein